MLLYVVTLLLVASSACAEDPRVKEAFSEFSHITNNMIPENYLRIYFRDGKEAELGNNLDIGTIGSGPVLFTTSNFTRLHTRVTVLVGGPIRELRCKGGQTLVEIKTNIIGDREGSTGDVVVPWLLPPSAFAFKRTIISVTCVHRYRIEQSIWTKISENFARGCFFLSDFIKDYGVTKLESGNIFHTKPLLPGK